MVFLLYLSAVDSGVSIYIFITFLLDLLVSVLSFIPVYLLSTPFTVFTTHSLHHCLSIAVALRFLSCLACCRIAILIIFLSCLCTLLSFFDIANAP